MSLTKQDEAIVLSKNALKYLCGLIRNTINMSEAIDDINLRTDGTFSSVKIDTLLNKLESECNEYTDRLVANLSRLELKIVTNEADINESNVLYLHKPDGATSYNQYVVIEGNKVLLGTTDISMTDYYTITQADAKFCLLTDYNSLKTAYESHTSDTEIHVSTTDREKWNEVDNKIDKTDIADNLTSTDTDKPLSANQGKVLKDEVDLKANDSEVVKKTDITTTIDSTSTDSEIATAKAVNDLLQTEGPGNLTIPLNEDLNNLIYNRTRVWMNSQTVQIATFTNMPSGRFTECAVIFIPYENATSDYGEQIFVGNYNRIFIRNKVNTTWTAWRRVCTTSSVADVPLTKIKLNNGFTGTLNFEVKNGVCYVTLIAFKSEKTGTSLIISDTLLPKPSIDVVTSTIHFDHDDVKIGMIYIEPKTDNRLRMHCYKANTQGWCTFSYPVSES